MDELTGARRGMSGTRGGSRGRGRGRGSEKRDRSYQRNDPSHWRVSQDEEGRGHRGGGRGTRGRRGGSHIDAAKVDISGSRNGPRPIGYQLLKIWTESTDSEELLMELCNKIEALEKLMMSDSMKEDWYSLLVQVINNAILCQHHAQKLKKLLRVVCTTHFLTHILSNYLEQKQMRGMGWTEAEGFFDSMLKIFRQVVKHLPEHAMNCKHPLKNLKLMIDEIEPVSTNQKLMEEIEVLISLVTKVQQGIMERRTAPKTKTYGPSADSEKPPEDFRELSVIPTLQDLSADVNPFVRAVITRGKYKDQEHYLDIQFRLMREDFYKPLRNGIKEFHEHGHGENFKSSNIRLYRDVHFTGMTYINGINHVIQFDISNMKHVKWDHSKRLLTGNLLCLSNDNFKSNMIFATVSFRDSKLLKNGVINIVCHSGLDTVLKSSSTEAFIMAETMAYYEAVHPILRGLQTIDSDLPLKDYIVSCRSQLKPPAYLLGGVREYDISCLMKSAKQKEVSVLNSLRWPSSEMMCLNPSQREAAIQALTKEISVIQGPPGTGKTYVGLKVMQVLLENQDRMLANAKSEHDPILVICYTNHALDQFLEGILGFCPDGIVRVGGKSSSADLEPFNLVNVKKKMRTESKAWKHSLWLLRQSLTNTMLEIDDVKKDVESLTTDILSEDKLIECISTEHYNSLQLGGSEVAHGKKKRSKIHQWLNASGKSLLEALPDMIKQHMIQLVVKILHLKGRKNLPRFDSEAPIIDRINIYGFWLSQYKNLLWSEREAQRDPNQRKYYDSLFEDSTRMSILNDSEIRKVINPAFLQQIGESFSSRAEEFFGTNSGFEAWVLGLQNELGRQLDDVEAMNRYIEKFQKGEDEGNDAFDDKEASDIALQHRQIFQDDTEEAKNLKATLQLKSNGMFLLNRAKLLGVQEDVEEEEWHGRNKQIEDEDGFRLVTGKKHFSFTQMKRFLSDDKFPPVRTEEEQSIRDIWNLGMKKRFSLYQLWIKRYKDMLIAKIEGLIQKYNDTKEELTETRMKEDIDLLKQAKVIGMTTTGAAKKRPWLEAVGCRTIVVEEAAEVLEAHIVTALNKNCQHLILIGDHKQLRPNPTVYEHAKHFGLDVSLFERLVMNNVPHVTLSEQHRMRESISVIMRHIYPSLQDHISVKGYENIRGVSKNVFFIQHNEKEESMKDTMSKSNPYEAEYLIGLCNYFLLQGYEPFQITVLATYAGQVLTLKKEMKKRNLKQGVRITPVDNFQGEENEIILLSLVRSNEKSNAGFLKVDNRVCVALSRAKKGMFAIGNIELLASQSDLWKKIKETAEKEGITGNGLPVACPNHPDEKNVIRTPRDFDRSPQGGCLKDCDFRLDCGHTCHLKCHGYNLEHKDFKCEAKCEKTCKEGHLCRKKCWQKCGTCIVPVDKLISSCGHTNQFPCNVVPKDTDCVSQCGRIMPCGHTCTGKCGECKKNGKHKICIALVTYFWPCDHKVEVPCHFKPVNNPCPKPCGELLNCGHKCPGKCSDCIGGAVHMACAEACRKTLHCGHVCQSVCSVPCPPCSLPCPVVCQHGPCSHSFKKRTCGEKCIPCQETCANKCPHRECSRKCHDKCDVLPCEKACQKVVGECGHPCAGLCGESCVCRICDEVLTIHKTPASVEAPGPSTTEETDSSDHGNKNILMKLPSCGHVFNLNEIDQYVKEENNAKEDSCQFIFCPQCSVPIQNCWHYGPSCQDRTGKRLLEKDKILAYHNVTNTVIWNLQESLRLVRDNDTNMVWFEWRHLDVEASTLKTAGEIITMSAKLKFAYVICEIISLKEEAESSLNDNGPDEQERIKALLNIKKSMSCQQIDDFKLDLKRILVVRYLQVLGNMAQNYKISFGGATSERLSQMRSDLKQAIVRNSVVEKGIVLMNAIERALVGVRTNSNLQALMMVKMNIVKRVLSVLDEENNKMLNEVLNSPAPLRPVAKASSTSTKDSVDRAPLRQVAKASSTRNSVDSALLRPVAKASSTRDSSSSSSRGSDDGERSLASGIASRRKMAENSSSSTAESSSDTTQAKAKFLSNFLGKLGISSSKQSGK